MRRCQWWRHGWRWRCGTSTAPSSLRCARAALRERGRRIAPNGSQALLVWTVCCVASVGTIAARGAPTRRWPGWSAANSESDGAVSTAPAVVPPTPIRDLALGKDGPRCIARVRPASAASSPTPSASSATALCRGRYTPMSWCSRRRANAVRRTHLSSALRCRLHRVKPHAAPPPPPPTTLPLAVIQSSRMHARLRSIKRALVPTERRSP